jgi:uncharacterized membrane protein
MMFGYGNHWAAWQVAFMGIVMIAVIGLLVWAFYTLMSNSNRTPDPEEKDDDARRTLDQRVAKGEIDPHEYMHLCDLIARKERTSVGSANQK